MGAILGNAALDNSHKNTAFTLTLKRDTCTYKDTSVFGAKSTVERQRRDVIAWASISDLRCASGNAALPLVRSRRLQDVLVGQ